MCITEIQYFDRLPSIWSYYKIMALHKKEWNNAVCTTMDATRDYYTKWRKSERERQTSYHVTYMWDLKYDTKEPIYETEREPWTQEMTGGCQGRGLGGRRGHLALAGISFYIGWIKKVLLHSMKNCIQYPIIEHNGKDYVYGWVTLLYSRNLQNYKLTMLEFF